MFVKKIFLELVISFGNKSKKYNFVGEKFIYILILYNNISLIIYGANLYDDADRIIDDYPTQCDTIITLTIKSVCHAFLNDHMTEDEIKELINKN